MLDTVLFDMGGTLEDIWFNEDTSKAVTQALMDLLARNGMQPDCDADTFRERVMEGVAKYKAWSQGFMLEKKPEEIWPEYYLSAFDFPKDRIAALSEEMAQTWESVYFHRELRPHVKETLEALQERGYKLGVISNTAALYAVFNVLDDYGIREYFQDVTLSSVTGYRKPHPHIFEIALRQNCSKAENTVYVGDTMSRDIIGSKRAKFGKAVQIRSFMTEMSDEKVQDSEFAPDCVITDIAQLVEYLDALRAEKA